MFRLNATFVTMLVLVLGTTIGLAGTDLILPAVPFLPDAIGGTQILAQHVLSAFVLGTGAGLILFGHMGARFDQRWLLIAALLVYAATSFLAALAGSITTLIALRFVQGLSAAAPAVFAPGIIKSMFSEAGAVRALGLIASVESAVPALAPIAGVWLLTIFGWTASFSAVGLMATATAIFTLISFKSLPPPRRERVESGFRRLAVNKSFVRHALGQAFTLGGLLTFVFGAPVMIVQSLGGTISDFVILQVTGVSCFILAANFTGAWVKRAGAEFVVMFGSSLAAIAAIVIVVYGLFGDDNPITLAALFAPMNMGLGMRGPPGFYLAIASAENNESQGSALVLLTTFVIAASGTTVAAPFLNQGLVPLAAVAAGLSVMSVVVLAAIPTRMSTTKQDEKST